MLVFPVNGECGFSGIWTLITASRSFKKNVLNPPTDATTYVRYTTGGTAALKIGETLSGGTSSATAKLIGQDVETGTAGSSDTGILFLRVLTGTPTAAGETWTGGTSTGTVATAQAPIALKFYTPPKSALFTIEAAAINFTQDGTTPTVTAGTNFGHQAANGQSFVITGQDNLNNFKCINAVASSGAIVKYSLFF